MRRRVPDFLSQESVINCIYLLGIVFLFKYVKCINKQVPRFIIIHQTKFTDMIMKYLVNIISFITCDKTTKVQIKSQYHLKDISTPLE